MSSPVTPPPAPVCAPKPPSALIRLLPWSFVAAAVLAAYWGVWQNGFLFDDLPAMPENAALRRGDWWAAAFGEPHQSLSNRPLTCLSLVLDPFAFGPFGPHLGNLLLHVGNALLLFAVLRRVLQAPNLGDRFGRSRATWIAAVTAALWGVHPLGVDAVAYATQRSTLLAGCCLLLALHAVLRGSATARPGRWRALAVLALAGGMASKEEFVAAPLLIVLFERAFLLPSWSAARARVGWYVALAGSWSVLGACLLLGPPNPTVGSQSGVTAWQWALTQAGVLVHYLRLAAWPAPLRGAYDWGVVTTLGPAVLPGLCVIGVLGLTLACWRRQPWWGWLGTWFFLLLAPTSSVMPIVTEVVAERRMYLPMLSVVVPLVVGGERLLALLPRVPRRWLAAVVLATVAVAACLATRQRVAVYRDSATFWSDAHAKRTPASRTFLAGLMLANMGDVAYAAGRVADACAYYDEAMACDGPTANTIARYAFSLLVRGRCPAAVEVMRRLVQSDPSSNTWGTLGLCLAVSHESDRGAPADPRLDEAEAALRRGVDGMPFAMQFWTALGYVLTVRGRLAEAEDVYRRVTESAVLEVEPFFSRAQLLGQLGRSDEIAPMFARLLAARPRDVELRLRLARSYSQRGELDAATATLEAALAIEPGNQQVVAALRELRLRAGR